IVLDQDDAAAVCTRYLVDHYFKDGAIRIRGGDNLPRKDKQAFTAIKSLYDALRSFIPAKTGEERRGFVYRVYDDDRLDEFCVLSKELFEWIGYAMPEIAMFHTGT